MTFSLSSIQNFLSTSIHSFFSPTIDLETIRQARGDINEIRLMLKGDFKLCHKLFKEAIKEEDVITQIQLSQALFGMKWGKDDSKDFSSLVVTDLETFSYYPSQFDLFKAAYGEAMEVEDDYDTKNTIAFETFRRAAALSYIPAILELKDKERKPDEDSYSFAMQLRPFVGQGDKKLDYCFGLSLRNGCAQGSKLYEEGLYWMNQSGYFKVEECPQFLSFETFTSAFIRHNSFNSSYETYKSFVFIGNSVLVPSVKSWQIFVKEKLEKIELAPKEFYLFNYDQKEIKFLLKEYKITASSYSRSVEIATEENDFTDIHGKTIHGFIINELDINQDHRLLGKISVRVDTLKIYESFENTNLKPLIEFIENLMTRTGSARTVELWLKRIANSNV